jgi:molybdopterin converting factor small subunit
MHQNPSPPAFAGLRRGRQSSPLQKGRGGSDIGTMKVRVQFYAQLRDLIGIRQVEVDVSKGATVRSLLEEIYAKQPALRSHDRSILIGAGVEFVGRSYRLKPGEEISIMPPVQGG